MIIGIDATRARSGGAKILLGELIRGFSAGDFGISEIHLWVSPSVDVPQVNSGLYVHQKLSTGGGLISLLLWQAFKLEKDAKEFGCELLVSMDSATPARFASHVVVLQDILAFEGREWSFAGSPRAIFRQLSLRALHSLAFRRSSLVVALSHYSAALASHKFSISDVVVLEPRPRTIERGCGEENQTIGTPVVEAVYVSHGSKYKNHENVLRAIPILRSFGIDMRITLVGGFDSGRLRALRRTMSGLGLSANEVVFAGWLCPDEVSREIRRSDIVLFASRAESLSYSLLEAIRLEKPIACSSSSVLPEILRQDGVYFDANNPVSIANACRMLVTDLDMMSPLAEDSTPESASTRGARIRSEFFAGISRLLPQSRPAKEAH